MLMTRTTEQRIQSRLLFLDAVVNMPKFDPVLEAHDCTKEEIKNNDEFTKLNEITGKCGSLANLGHDR